MTRYTRVAPLAALMLGVVGTAQGACNDPPPDRPQRQALRGPQAQGDQAPGRRAAAADQERPGRNAAQERPAAAFFALRAELKRLGSERTPEDLRLTDGQAEQIKKIGEQFQDERRAYMDAHADEIKALREAAGLPPMLDRAERREGLPQGERPRDGRGASDAPRPDDRPRDGRGARNDDDRPRLGRARGQGNERPGPGPDGFGGDDMPPPPDGMEPGAGRGDPPTPEQIEARQKLRDLMEAGPSPEKAMKDTLAVLRPEQRHEVETRLRELAERARERGPRTDSPMQGRRTRQAPDDTRPPQPPPMDQLDLPDADD